MTPGWPPSQSARAGQPDELAAERTRMPEPRSGGSSPFLHLRATRLALMSAGGEEMPRRMLAGLMAAAIAGTVTMWAPWSVAGASRRAGYEPVLNPADFVRKVTNPYFPLPVGRTLIYRGIKDGKSQVDRVHVTSRTKVLEGITAVTVTDVARHNGHLLEKTTDWYAQDKQGNVWYLGEDTAAYLPGGKVDRSGSWQAGVHDAEPGLVMETNPQIPDAYRQEFLSGQAEDTAWVVDTSGSFTVPDGTFKNALTSLEATRIEPGAYDRKVYAPGVGMIREEALTGAAEYAELVSVSG